MKNLFNRQSVEELNGRLISDSRHVALAMPAGGRVVLVDPGVPLPDSITGAVIRGTMDALRISNAVHEASNDPGLSDIGKGHRRAALETERAKVAAKFEKAATQIEDFAMVARMGEENLYQPEPVASTADALVDQEIRDYFRNLEGETRTSALETLQQNADPRQLLALARSPIPLPEPLQQIVTSGWELHLATDRAAKFAEVNSDRAVATWAVNAVAQIRQVLDGLAYRDPNASLADMQAIRPHVENARAA